MPLHADPKCPNCHGKGIVPGYAKCFDCGGEGCRYCNDKGTINDPPADRACRCLRDWPYCEQGLPEGCGIPRAYRNVTSGTFQRDWDGDSKLARHRESTVRAIAKWINQPASPGLYLYGGLGVGKTHLAASILTALYRRGQNVQFLAVRKVGNELREAAGANSHALSDAMAPYERCSALVIDDLGSGRPSPFLIDQIAILVDSRAVSDALTIFTSNFAPHELAERELLDGRTVSRIIGMSQGCILELLGGDYRTRQEDAA